MSQKKTPTSNSYLNLRKEKISNFYKENCSGHIDFNTLTEQLRTKPDDVMMVEKTAEG